jgi:hypothetical protein
MISDHKLPMDFKEGAPTAYDFGRAVFLTAVELGHEDAAAMLGVSVFWIGDWVAAYERWRDGGQYRLMRSDIWPSGWEALYAVMRCEQRVRDGGNLWP